MLPRSPLSCENLLNAWEAEEAEKTCVFLEVLGDGDEGEMKTFYVQEPSMALRGALDAEGT